jgi:hypothetical protein
VADVGRLFVERLGLSYVSRYESLLASARNAAHAVTSKTTTGPSGTLLSRTRDEADAAVGDLDAVRLPPVAVGRLAPHGRAEVEGAVHALYSSRTPWVNAAESDVDSARSRRGS